MALTLNTNVSSLSIQRAMSETSRALAVSMQRLSTGYRLNSSRPAFSSAALQAGNGLNGGRERYARKWRSYSRS